MTAQEDRALAFVAVVFDAEIDLLHLQATSLAVFAPQELVSQIIVIDNTVFGIRGRGLRRLLAAYGPHAGRVRLVRSQELAVDRRADGWRSQQAAKLLISRAIEAPHYVILDAKNHFIRPLRRSDFIGDDDVPHGGRHSYLSHPLRQDLVHTLTALEMPATEIQRAEEDFPVTATPFVMPTAAVRAAVDDLERRTGRGFAEAFERARLLEFFYFSGWMQLHRPEDPISDGVAISAPTIWGADPSQAAVEAAISQVVAEDAPVFSVHRRALKRASDEARDAVRRFWGERQLLTERESRALVRRFLRRYTPSMALTRLAEKARRLR